MDDFAEFSSQITNELMFLAFCVVGTACTRFDDGNVKYNREKHLSLFGAMSSAFDEFAEAQSVKDEASDIIDGAEQGKSESE